MSRGSFFQHWSFGPMTSEQWTLAVATVATLGMIALIHGATKIRWRPLAWPFGRRGQGDGIQVGREWISDDARLRHTHIVGATGSGKTVLMEQLILRDLERGSGAIIVDPKGDRELFSRVKHFCRKIGRSDDLKLLSTTYADESVVWNPCRLGNASELQSKFYNAAIYSEPHYAKACELALLSSFNRLVGETSVAFTLLELVSALDSISRGGKDETVAGLYLDLNNLVQGDWGTLLGCREMGKRPEVTLLDITRKNEILFVDLPTEAQAVQSARVGRLILQEIILISGLRKLYPHLRSSKPFSVFVDEFDAFASQAFATFLNKGRSSGFMIHLAHQTLSDLDRVGEAFRGQIMGNVNVRFVFRQDDPDDAETWSRFFGTRKTTKRTFQAQDGQATGMSSNREVQEFRISPDFIKQLKTGECVFGQKTSGIARVLQVPFESGNTKSRLNFPNLREPVEREEPETRRARSAFDEKLNGLQKLVMETAGE